MVFFFAPNLSNIVLVFHRILDLKARGWIYILAPFYCLKGFIPHSLPLAKLLILILPAILPGQGIQDHRAARSLPAGT